MCEKDWCHGYVVVVGLINSTQGHFALTCGDGTFLGRGRGCAMLQGRYKLKNVCLKNFFEASLLRIYEILELISLVEKFPLAI